MDGGFMLGIEEPNEKEGRVYKTEINVEVPVFIPIPEIIDHPIKTKDINCILTLKHAKEDYQKSGITMEGNVWYQNDRWGRVYRSSVKLILDHSTNPILVTPDYPLDSLHEALRIINRVIEISRVVVDEFFLYKVVDADIAKYDVKGFGADGQVIKGSSSIQYTPGLTTIISEDKTFYHFDKSPKILEILCSGEEIPLEKGLIRNALDYLLSENFRSAIIEAQTAVETTIKKIIHLGMIKNGKDTKEIENLFEKTGFKNIVNDHLSKYIKSKFDEDNEIYRDWWNNCYGLRNKVAHEGLYPVKLQAESAIKAAKNTISFLEENKVN